MRDYFNLSTKQYRLIKYAILVAKNYDNLTEVEKLKVDSVLISMKNKLRKRNDSVQRKFTYTLGNESFDLDHYQRVVNHDNPYIVE